MSARITQLRKKLSHISDYHGLNSPGLTCYLNSVLQVLFMTHDFREVVKSSSKYSSTIDPHLGALFTDLESRTAKTHDVTKKLGITGVSVCKQRDAAEYFEKILHLCSPEASKIFKGELNHKTTCLHCKERDETKTPFWTLPLAMEVSCSSCSVEEGLQTVFKREEVRGDDKLYCDRCGNKQDTAIECEVTQHPEILTILLKRFTFDKKRRCYVKLHCKVDVPQTLQVEGCTYDLYGLVHHFGSLTGGHYTAQIKSFDNGAWYSFNDSVVEKLREPGTYLRSDTAYLLMYKKNKSRDPGKLADNNQGEFCSHSSEKAERKHDDLKKFESCNTSSDLPNTNSKKQTNQRATQGGRHKDMSVDSHRCRPSPQTQNWINSLRERQGRVATEGSNSRETVVMRNEREAKQRMCSKPRTKTNGSDSNEPRAHSESFSSSVSYIATNSTK